MQIARVLNRPERVLARGNIIAGIAVGAYLIPQAMAYGDLAGVGPHIGLSMAVIPLLLYPLLGTSRWLSLGPESATALMAAVTVAPIAARHPDQALAIMGTLTFLVGVLMLAGRMIRAGAIADLLSRPVLIGYMAGIATLMTLSQMPKLLGPGIDSHNIITFARTLPDAVLDPVAVTVAAVTVGTLIACKRISDKLPGALIALAASIVVGAIIGAPTIADAAFQIPATVALPQWDLVGEMILPALAVTVVAFSDSILTARAFSGRGERIDANRELASYGIISVLNSFVGAYPSSSSSSRTAIAKASHAANRWYSWIVLAILLLSPLVLGRVLTLIPVAALAGIVLYAAKGLVNWAGLAELGRFRIQELTIALVTTASVITLGILPGIGIAVALSIGELLVRLMRPHEGVLGFVPGLAGMHDIDDHPDAVQIPGLVVFRYDAPLFFANGSNFYEQTMNAVETQDTVTWVILNMEACVEVDTTGLKALEHVHHELAGRGIHLALARVKNDLATPMTRFGTMAVIGPENIYPTLPTAVEAYQEWCRAQEAPPCATCPGNCGACRDVDGHDDTGRAGAS